MRKADGWWLPLTYEEEISLQTPRDAPVMEVDVGVTRFLTTSTGKHFGSFHGTLAQRHQRDREKRRRTAKLRACLKQKSVERLPATRTPKRARAVRQEIKRAVNELYREYPDRQIAFEQLNVATRRYTARRMNACWYASNLAHLPKQLAWGAAERGRRSTSVTSAYTSQQCPRCHVVNRSNRPEQHTCCGGVCGVGGHRMHADHNAAVKIAARLGDHEIEATRTRQELEALLEARHQRWRHETGWSSSNRPVAHSTGGGQGVERRRLLRSTIAWSVLQCRHWPGAANQPHTAIVL
jgi:transposase